MSRVPRALFVYGTLRPGGRYWANIAEEIEQYTPAMVSGFDLYHLSNGYPAMVDGDSEVFGDLLFIHSGREADVLRITDEIEQYVPGDSASLYVRREVLAIRLTSPEAPKIPVDTYIFNPAHKPYLLKNGTHVPGGEWHAS